MDASQLWELVTKTRGCGADPWHWELHLPGTKPPLLLQEKGWEQLLVPSGVWGEAELLSHQNVFTHRSDEIQTKELDMAVGTRPEGFAPLHAAQEAVHGGSTASQTSFL